MQQPEESACGPPARTGAGGGLAIEGLVQALRQRQATPAEISREAEAAGVWATMEPYVMALTSDA